MNKYKTIQASSIEEFDKLCNEAAKDEWMPLFPTYYGGIEFPISQQWYKYVKP